MNSLWTDSIIDEVRKAGAELAKECDYDVHKFAEMLSRNELIRKKEGWKFVGKEELETVDISKLQEVV